MNIIQIKETCIYSEDLDKAQNFYADILKLPLISRSGNRHVFFRAGTSVLLIFNPVETSNETNLPAHFATGKIHIAFEVPEADYLKYRNHLIESGTEILHDQDWNDGRKSFYFNDPDGNVLEIIMPGIWD